MTPVFSARRADEFETLLSRPRGTPLTDRDARQFAALLEVVEDLRAVPPVQARPEFVHGLRERLMAEADTVLVPRPAGERRDPRPLTLPTSSRPRQRRLAVLLGGAAVVGATTSMAVAAQGALPGEALYPVKRGLESTQVRLATSDAARGDALLAHAGDRLAELEEMAAEDPAGSTLLIPDTLDDFTAQAREGSDLLLASHDAGGADSEAQRVREFTASSLGRLESLESLVPASARDELVEAGRALIRIDEDATSACPTCRGGIAMVPDFVLRSSAPADLLGGLDSNQAGLGGVSVTDVAPISGQDVTGIEVPEELQLPGSEPTGPVPTEVPTPTPDTQGPKPVKDKVRDVVNGTTDTVDDTTDDVTDTVDEVTGGAVGGLTGELDDVTGGLIGDVTGSVDDLTGNTVTGSTDGLLD